MRDITLEEIEYWDRHNDERNNAKYVQIEDCQRLMDRSDERTEALEKAFAVSNTKLNILIGILATIGVAIVPVCLKLLFKV